MMYVHGAEVEGICGRGVHADIDRLTEPMMWTPRILSVLASLSSLTRPSASAVVCVVEGSGRGGEGRGEWTLWQDNFAPMCSPSFHHWTE